MRTGIYGVELGGGRNFHTFGMGCVVVQGFVWGAAEGGGDKNRR